ncbi:hypothetical protein [Methanosarcina sp. UBA411]|jgi:hypothetical protein|uniref:hypothetical protein n=1 Tax=Methanosarcina sp. UBA411 TaxID=1915589 RepID=UPI0025D6848C|nr:hypothetical protein [Methanosarcina sp. UBA411]
MLSYEIEKAIDRYKIPLIITYVDYQVVAKPNKLSKYWPEALRSRIEDGTAKAIHILFTKDTILRSIEQFNVYNMPATAMDTYSKADYRTFGSSG